MKSAIKDGLRLTPISGPTLTLAPGMLAIQRGQQVVIGRGVDCRIALPDPSVSREHASITSRSGLWYLRDLGSRHGTFLNAVQIQADAAHPIQDGDLVRIGPWTMRIDIGEEHAESDDQQQATLIKPDGATHSRIEPVGALELAQQRLNLLLDGAARLNDARDEVELATAAVDSILTGTEFEQAAYIKQSGHGVDVISARSRGDAGPNAASPSSFIFSSSLLEAAAGGKVVRLANDEQPDSVPVGQSIVHLGITSAMCAPILLGGAAVAYLYLDARTVRIPIGRDSADFCQAMARMCSMSLERLKRIEVERRQRHLEADLNAARAAQKLIVPEEAGERDGFRYAMQMKPGSIVAGDLFDVVFVDEHRTAVVLGDVTGEGAGAAIIMAGAQAHLHASLAGHGDPARALNEVNEFLCRHPHRTRFISLWAGVVNHQTRAVTYVDAGHGYWCCCSAAGTLPERAPQPGGTLLGIDCTLRYESSTMVLAPGDRVVLFSDGMVEQPNAEGEQFSAERVREVLQGATSVADAVARIFDAVTHHAGSSILADDATAASFEITA
ncbi:MAG: SpoIIE family protein phosphatase [Phycisphaerales bacterium]